jgi:hypothetical protein
MFTRGGLLLALALALAAAPALARIEGMHVKKDTRTVVLVEHFGFVPGGVYRLNLTEIKIAPAAAATAPPPKLGFLIRRTRAEEGIASVLQRQRKLDRDGKGACVLDAPASNEVVHLIDASATTLVHEATVARGGLFQTLLVNCNARPVSFALSLTQYNPGPDYLSVGHSPLPALYLSLGLVVLALLLVWMRELIVNRRQVMKIHGVMAVLVSLKCISLLLESAMYHYIKLHGHASGWDVAFYIFHSLKGITLFMVILLVGTGWSFLKPFLHGHEKQVLAVVIPMQVISNVAGVVMDETMPGAQSWYTWTDIVHLFDIMCCFAVLLPIGWSIHSLQEASATDGKAARNLSKLKLFRQFYSVVWAYIYFTRIVVYILQLTLNYRYVWLANLSSEIGTIAFYIFSGFRFRPLSSNPYFLIETRDLDEEDEDGGGGGDGGERGLGFADSRSRSGRGGLGGGVGGDIPLETLEPDFSL